MKILKYIALCCVVFATSATADPHNPERMKRHFEMMINKLELNETQISQIKALRERYRPMMEEIRDSDASREEMRERVMQLRAQQESEMRTILTDEQFELFSQMKQKLKDRRQKRMRNGEGKRERG